MLRGPRVHDDRSRPVAAGRRRPGGARAGSDRRAGHRGRRRSASPRGVRARARARGRARAHAARRGRAAQASRRPRARAALRSGRRGVRDRRRRVRSAARRARARAGRRPRLAAGPAGGGHRPDRCRGPVTRRGPRRSTSRGIGPSGSTPCSRSWTTRTWPSCARAPRRPRRSRSSSAVASRRWSARREPARRRCSRRSAPTRSWTRGGILLLAPTGKAAVQLASRTGSRRRTSRSSCASTTAGTGTAAVLHRAAGEARHSGRTHGRHRRGVDAHRGDARGDARRARPGRSPDPVRRPSPASADRRRSAVRGHRRVPARAQPGTGGGVAELRTGRRQVAEQAADAERRSTMSRSRRCSPWTPPLPERTRRSRG